MTGRCKLVHYTTGVDPNTGRDITEEHVDLDDVRCLIRPESAVAQVTTSEATGIVQVMQMHQVTLPANTIVPPAATTVVPKTSVGDPGMVGVPMQIVDRPYDDWQIAVKLRVRADVTT